MSRASRTLSNAVVVVTGASGGIGRATAIEFARLGHGILINVGSVLSQVGQAFVPAYAISLLTFHMIGRQPTTNGSLFVARQNRGTIRGSRRPIVGRVKFVGWLAEDLRRMGRAWWRGRGLS